MKTFVSLYHKDVGVVMNGIHRFSRTHNDI